VIAEGCSRQGLTRFTAVRRGRFRPARFLSLYSPRLLPSPFTARLDSNVERERSRAQPGEHRLDVRIPVP